MTVNPAAQPMPDAVTRVARVRFPLPTKRKSAKEKNHFAVFDRAAALPTDYW